MPKNTDSGPTAAAFRYAVTKVIQRRQRLQKSKLDATALQEFLLQTFQMPCSTVTSSTTSTCSNSDGPSTFQMPCSTSDTSPTCSTSEEHSTSASRKQPGGSFLKLEGELVKKVNGELAAEADKWKSLYERESQRLQGRYNPHNVR